MEKVRISHWQSLRPSAPENGDPSILQSSREHEEVGGREQRHPPKSPRDMLG